MQYTHDYDERTIPTGSNCFNSGTSHNWNLAIQAYVKSKQILLTSPHQDSGASPTKREARGRFYQSKAPQASFSSTCARGVQLRVLK
jgi:hypothetical protein